MSATKGSKLEKHGEQAGKAGQLNQQLPLSFVLSIIHFQFLKQDLIVP